MLGPIHRQLILRDVVRKQHGVQAAPAEAGYADWYGGGGGTQSCQKGEHARMGDGLAGAEEEAEEGGEQGDGGEVFAPGGGWGLGRFGFRDGED